MKSKKSQAAMEFLMTYGWAILVALIVISALAYFGVLNPERFLLHSNEIKGLASDCDIGDNLNVVLCLRNAFVYQYNVTIEPDCSDAVYFYSVAFSQFKDIRFTKVDLPELKHVIGIVSFDNKYCMLDIDYLDCVAVRNNK